MAADKIKEKRPGQRACNERDEKGQLCVGHLKRWYTPSLDAVKAIPSMAAAYQELLGKRRTAEKALHEVGRTMELYRCERCHTLYLPAPQDISTAGQRFEPRTVNILGDTIRPR